MLHLIRFHTTNEMYLYISCRTGPDALRLAGLYHSWGDSFHIGLIEPH